MRQLPDVRVIDIDDLRNGLSINLEARRREVHFVEAVIAGGGRQFRRVATRRRTPTAVVSRPR